MYSLGTETDRLFRTRSGGDDRVDHFGSQFRSMADRVRAVYGGLLAHDMQYKADWRDWFASGSWHLWEDLDRDVIGVSAWFPLGGGTDGLCHLVIGPIRRRAAQRATAMIGGVD